MIQFDDFWPTIAEKVRVYRNDVSHLSAQAVHLEDGPALPCDIFLLGTGFKEAYNFFDESEHIRLGLQHAPLQTAEEDEWRRLRDEADTEILKTYPMLKETPGYVAEPNKTTFRLYNAIASLNDPTIAFVGCVSVTSMFSAAETQALWASAYLDGNIDLPSLPEMKRQIAIDNQCSRRRYPWYGATSGIVFDLECVLYADRLLAELGLTSHVDGWSWWQYWFRPTFQSDYKGALDEYRARVKKTS